MIIRLLDKVSYTEIHAMPTRRATFSLALLFHREIYADPYTNMLVGSR